MVEHLFLVSQAIQKAMVAVDSGAKDEALMLLREAQYHLTEHQNFQNGLGTLDKDAGLAEGEA